LSSISKIPLLFPWNSSSPSSSCLSLGISNSGFWSALYERCFLWILHLGLRSLSVPWYSTIDILLTPGYPNMTHSTARGPSFSSLVDIHAYTLQPKTLRWSMSVRSNFRLFHSKKGVLRSPVADDGHVKNVACSCGKPEWMNRHLITFKRVWLRCSAMPFCCGVCGTDNRCWIPFFSRWKSKLCAFVVRLELIYLLLLDHPPPPGLILLKDLQAVAALP
jgi:hypothetical protein